MTSHQAPKRLVRARMERTGETYSTARPHVLATAPAGVAIASPGAVSGYDTFGGGAHRDSALLHNMLQATGHTAPHTGDPWTEPMLAGLAGGIGFMYFVFEYAGHVPTMTIVTRHHPEPYLAAALRRTGVPHSIAHTGSAAKARKALESVLADDRPAICAVSRYALPWRVDPTGLGGADACPVGVAGVDGDRLLIDDGCTSPSMITFDEFMIAWSAYPKGKHEMITIGDPSAGSPDLAVAIRDAVSTACAHLTGPVLGNAFDTNFGFSGMVRLAAQLRDTRTRTGWSRRFGEPRELFHGLRRIYDCLEVEYGGPSAIRPLYADFLRETAGVVGLPAYVQAADLFDRSGAAWSMIASRATSMSPALSGYRNLITDRSRLLAERGAAAAPELGGLVEAIAELEAQMIKSPPHPAEVAALFTDLADRVDAARALEEEAVDLLVGTTVPLSSLDRRDG